MEGVLVGCGGTILAMAMVLLLAIALEEERTPPGTVLWPEAEVDPGVEKLVVLGIEGEEEEEVEKA